MEPENYPIVEDKYSFNSLKFISEDGTNANVYFINKEKDLCAKILKKKEDRGTTLLNDNTSLKNLLKEYLFMRYGFSNHAKVCAPYGIFNLESETGDKFPGFVMEYDKEYKTLEDSCLEWSSDEVRNLILEQEELLENLGFEVTDSRHKLNILYNSHKKDIKLIDAGNWCYYGYNRDSVWNSGQTSYSQLLN